MIALFFFFNPNGINLNVIHVKSGVLASRNGVTKEKGSMHLLCHCFFKNGGSQNALFQIGWECTFTVLITCSLKVAAVSEHVSAPAVLFHHCSWPCAHGGRSFQCFLFSNRMERKPHVLPGARGGTAVRAASKSKP